MGQGILSDWRILVVDDVLDNISLIETVFEFQGSTVYSARNGFEGLEAVKTFKPNLILLDLSMPEMDGWEMHRQLQENPETTDIPVIALTAHAMDGVKEKVLNAGFTGYITKPFSVTNIATQVKMILSDPVNTGHPS